MKKTISALLIFSVIIVFAFGGYYWWFMNSSPPSNDTKAKTVLIKKGSSANEIADVLHEKGIIKNPLAFKMYVQMKGVSKDIFAGEYSLPSNLNLEEVVSSLRKGPSGVWVTIPEGYRREQIATKFALSFGLEGEDRIKFINDFLKLSEGSEGFLFPDTYLFPKTSDAEKVVLILKDNFDKKITPELQSGIDSSPYSEEEILTMASLIERETKSEEERSIVSGILWKRIENEWPLQVDASVQYGISQIQCKVSNLECDWWPILTKADIEYDTPYNTYNNLGLPPSPIANPGISSIEAAIFPKDSEYWFYIHSDDGKIYYAKTVDEHNENIRKYLGK